MELCVTSIYIKQLPYVYPMTSCLTFIPRPVALRLSHDQLPYVYPTTSCLTSISRPVALRLSHDQLPYVYPTTSCLTSKPRRSWNWVHKTVALRLYHAQLPYVKPTISALWYSCLTSKLAQFSLNNVHKKDLKHQHFFSLRHNHDQCYVVSCLTSKPRPVLCWYSFITSNHDQFSVSTISLRQNHDQCSVGTVSLRLTHDQCYVVSCLTSKPLQSCHCVWPVYT